MVNGVLKIINGVVSKIPVVVVIITKTKIKTKIKTKTKVLLPLVVEVLHPTHQKVKRKKLK